MLYEPTTLMEDSASNTSSSLDSFTTNTTTTTTDSETCSCSPQHKHHHHHHHDLKNNIGSHHSQSSNNSSRISNGSKRRAYHLLLREIRRLRAENDGLCQMVDTIKQDLRFERESRQISERCHQKYYTESSDRQVELELDVMDKDSEIADLKERIAVLEAASSPTVDACNNNNVTTPALSRSSSFSRWGCFDFDDDDDDALFCQPVMGESATPDPLATLDRQRGDSSEDDEDDDEAFEHFDDDDDDNNTVEHDHNGYRSSGPYPKTTTTDDEKFEQLATSYLHQAILSKLTSARANLELDDLMLKYDPSPAVVLRMLATSFVVWVNNVVSSSNDSAVKSLTHAVTEGFLNFWKAILEKHVHDEDDQCQFLNEAERILDTKQEQPSGAAAIVDNFHRLLIMLYKYDIVDGEAITRWWHSVVVVEDEEGHVACRLRGVTKSFAQWLDEDEEDEEDDDSDDDDDDDSVFDDHKVLDSMLEQDREYCACQFEENIKDNDNGDMKDNNTINNHNNNTAHSNQSPEQPGTTCKCQDIYTTTTTSSSSSPTSHTADEKKPKKSVRIVL
ncbi:hypothetical protein BDB00DRAFT_788544 [Zychaea mexicana]|uniref:uncharacterized protein n=1 Tax=Zychaea mexicana TaxID=64656 RepID=UPI0022FE3D94|nr:uncharacterized protein BDB00DRAFT_788544 [Zychaea mexicana]KAI9492728.1 hypothetical protein BDB00DRAFT_788544 [Zychaea mexicana]